MESNYLRPSPRVYDEQYSLIPVQLLVVWPFEYAEESIKTVRSTSKADNGECDARSSNNE